MYRSPAVNSQQAAQPGQGAHRQQGAQSPQNAQPQEAEQPPPVDFSKHPALLLDRMGSYV
mgnify:FL=1